jgi:hypothetical protein
VVGEAEQTCEGGAHVYLVVNELDCMVYIVSICSASRIGCPTLGAA